MICEIFPVLNFHQLFPASFGWRTKRQSNPSVQEEALVLK
jgi:hypothetical protein